MRVNPMPTFRFSSLATMMGSLLIVQTACQTNIQPKNPAPKPLTYQQEFDKNLNKLNLDLSVYASLDCHDPKMNSLSQLVKQDLVTFSDSFEKMSSTDKNYIKDTEIGLGVIDVINAILDSKKKCIDKDRNTDQNTEPSYLNHGNI